MTRTELLDAAGERLSQAVILLTAAGEDCLAFQVEAVAEGLEHVAERPPLHSCGQRTSLISSV
jgi:hypothetical protein